MYSSRQTALVYLLTGLAYAANWVSSVESKAKLSHVSSVYLPTSVSPSLTYEYSGEAVEQIAYHAREKLVYAVGERILHVVDITNVTNPTRIFSVAAADTEQLTDVEVCGDYIFVTASNEQDGQPGHLKVYKKYDQTKKLLPLMQTIEVGPFPTMVRPLSGCRTVLVLLQGRRFQAPGGQWTDPPGIVMVIDFPKGLDSDVQKKTALNFTKFDGSLPPGARQVYNLDNTTFSTDAEPVYVVVDDKAKKAYVGLQSNNAIGEVDLSSKTIKGLFGLGYKQWGYLDASSQGNEVGVTFWPIRAWYQPLMMQFQKFRGKRLLFTANEGSNRRYSDGFDEVRVGKDFPRSDLGSSIPKWMKDALQDERRLGQLEFSKYDGKVNGTFQALYTFGGRGWGVWDVDNDMKLLFDSGSDVEEKIAMNCPHLFNRDAQSTNIDTESNKKGPESEAIETAVINGRLYVFVGNENPGTISLYSIGSDAEKPRFEQLFCEGFPEGTRTPQEMYQARDLYAVDPDDLRFVPARDSPSDFPILLVAGEVSGTVTVLRVDTGLPGRSSALTPGLQAWEAVLVSASLFLLQWRFQ